MKSYMDFIEGTRLIDEIDAVVTTGDLDYPGTAMEIREAGGDELFHIVVDASGAMQVLFLPHGAGYRLPLSKIEAIIVKSKEEVRFQGCVP